MKTEDLTGNRILSGVELSIEQIRQYGDNFEDATVIRFVIDGITYKAKEDPNDGYRSQCEDIEISEEEISNMFEPHEVIGTMKENNEWYKNDVIIFTDVKTGKTVLEIGTENSDDYYPSCVMYFAPENLFINSKHV